MKTYLVLFILLLTGGVRAEFQMVWSSVGGGGGKSVGQTLSLESTAAQPTAGVSQADGLVLNAGYQAGSRGCGVNLNDLIAVCEAWLGEDAALNLTGAAEINLDDFAVLAAYWLDDCPAGWPVE